MANVMFALHIYIIVHGLIKDQVLLRGNTFPRANGWDVRSTKPTAPIHDMTSIIGIRERHERGCYKRSSPTEPGPGPRRKVRTANR